MDVPVARWRCYLLVQPLAMLFLLALSMSGNVLTDLIVYRTCVVTMKINKTECDILHNNSSSEEALRINSIVQPYTGLILMGKSFIESIFPTILTLFLGPWSDKYGRKPILISVYIGGTSALMLASVCYITDITSDNERAWHLAWLDVLISVGLLIGLLSGPLIFKAYGYAAVFGTVTVICILTTLYIFFIPETIQNEISSKKIFNFKFIKDIYDTCIKKRDGFDRLLVWSCIACLILQLIIIQGSSSIGFLFASARLGWTVEEYSTYVALNIMITVLGTMFGVKLIPKYTGLPEAIIAIISVISALGSTITGAFAWKSWHMYLAMIIGMFGDISRSMVRAILSKAVPAQDIGKVFSLAMSLETLIPFAATSLYTLLYSHYMPPIYPLPAGFLSAIFYVLTIGILICIQIQVIKRTRILSSQLTDSDSAD
ncbi:proton-coupled folate transporter-like isoform X2 [Pogonomyrmex barbatus]|uniref:Proton-coupled folate transporter-like isoform X2 n=1 Tax=Pogonomyrmex barbatus TaxID=144034 RepID=A0A6I9W743_9HYME|nr:proton-coupled folate transporter-like isoform X2 [Pogonomyrmex barbatus]